MAFRTTTNPDGTVTIHDVPVFPTCKRGDDEYDTEWLEKAFNRLKQAKDEGHLPPVHVYHHGDGDRPSDAGWMEPKRIGPLRWRGRDHNCIYADLVVNDDFALEMIAKKKLRYRSVELSDDNPDGVLEITSLALLDSEPPYVEMPMTFIDPDHVPAGTNGSVTWTKALASDRPVLCFRRQGATTQVLMEAEMPEDPKLFQTDDDDDDDAVEKMQDEGTEDEDSGDSEGDDKGGDEEEVASFDLGAVCAAIKEGKIPLNAFAELRAAMDAAESMVATEEEEMTEPVVPPKPSNNPPEPQNMQKRAKESAERFKLESRVATLEAERERDQAIDKGLDELKAHAFSGNPAERLRKEYDEGAGDGGHKAGLSQLRLFVKYAKENAPRPPGNYSEGDNPSAADLPDDAKELLNGDPTHDEAVSRAFRAHQKGARGFRKIPFATYWKANGEHFKAPVPTGRE